MASESDWKAEEDARTLARAEEIKADPSKMSAATVAATRMVAEEAIRLRGLQKVSGKKVVLKGDANAGNEIVRNVPIPSVSPVIKGLKFGIGKQPGTW